jgi:hypothetical protein
MDMFNGNWISTGMVNIFYIFKDSLHDNFRDCMGNYTNYRNFSDNKVQGERGKIMEMMNAKYKVDMQVPGFINIWVKDTDGNEKEWTINIKYIHNITYENQDVNDCFIKVHCPGSDCILEFDSSKADKSKAAREAARKLHNEIKSCIARSYAEATTFTRTYVANH